MNIQSLVFSKGLGLMVLASISAGCGGPVRDTDLRISGLIHQCFATVKESIFLSGRCQPLGAWPYCDTVKAINAQQQRLPDLAQLPPTLQAYRENPVYWSGQIHAQQNYFYRKGGDHLVIYGGLPIGTPLEIVQVSRWFNGENGTFWIADANIRDGEFKGRRILLPWEGIDERGWIHAEYEPKKGELDPEANSEYLTQCEATPSISSPR